MKHLHTGRTLLTLLPAASIHTATAEAHGSRIGLPGHYRPPTHPPTPPPTQVTPADILDFELNVCDVQPGTIGGARDEFVFCGRLDNLAMSYVALQA